MSTVGTCSYCSIPSYPGIFGTAEESQILRAMMTAYVHATCKYGHLGLTVKPYSMYRAESHLRRALLEDKSLSVYLSEQDPTSEKAILKMGKVAISTLPGTDWYTLHPRARVTVGCKPRSISPGYQEEEREWGKQREIILDKLIPLRKLKKSSQELHSHIFTQGGQAGTGRQRLTSLLEEMQSVQQPLRKIWETLPPSSEDLQMFHSATTDWDMLRLEDLDFQEAQPKFQDDGTITQRLEDYQQSFLGLSGTDDVATKFARLAESTKALSEAVLVRWDSENPDSDEDRGARGIESGDGNGGAIDFLYGARGDDHME